MPGQTPHRVLRWRNMSETIEATQHHQGANTMTDPPTPTRLGAMISKARLGRDLSIRQLAPRVGLSYSQLSRIESGTARTTAPDVLQRLAHALDVDEYALCKAAGFTPALPDPITYFRTVYGVTRSEATAMLALLHQHYPTLTTRQEGSS